MTKSERLLKRLREELPELPEMPDDARIVRTYAGFWMRTAGAFVWMVETDHPTWCAEIGSRYTVTRLLGYPKLSIWPDDQDWEIGPDDSNEQDQARP